jgi:hypothetical protein
MLDDPRLDPLSARFTQRLLETYPEWRRFGRVIEDAQGRPAVEFQVPRPSGGRNLIVDTFDSEITVAFGDWHTHVWPGLSTDLTLDDLVDEALACIEEIVSEDLVVVVWSKQGQVVGGTAGAPSELENPKPGTSEARYSWLGTYDRHFDE